MIFCGQLQPSLQEVYQKFFLSLSDILPSVLWPNQVLLIYFLTLPSQLFLHKQKFFSHLSLSLTWTQLFQESDHPACRHPHHLLTLPLLYSTSLALSVFVRVFPFFSCSHNPKLFWLWASSLISLSTSPAALKCWSTSLVHSLHFFHPLTLYHSYCPVCQLPPCSTLCRLCIMSQDEAHNTPLICFSGCDLNCFGQARHGCPCQRSFC